MLRQLRLVGPADALGDDESGPDPRLAELLTEPLSAFTLAEIDGYDRVPLHPADRVNMLALWERHVGWIASRQQQAIVDVTGPATASPGSSPSRESMARGDWAELEVAAALRLSPVSASRRVAAARELTGRLTATLEAVATGEITFWYALSLVEAFSDLDDATAHRVQRQVLAGAAGLTISGFRARLRRAVLATGPAAADQRHTAARQDRRVVLDPQPDAMAWLSVFLTAPEAIAAYRQLDADAKCQREGADPAAPSSTADPIDTLRADAFLAAVLRGRSQPPGQAQPRRASSGVTVQVQVTADLPTLLRLADNPAQLDGYGPIPPELARQLAADADWRRFLLDDVTGHLLDYGRSTYRPPQALADYVMARDVTCRFPGCARAARRCDLDHEQPWNCAGSTCSANLGALCRHHHRAKTHAGWKLRTQPDGAARWTSPRGHPYLRPAINNAPEHIAHLAARREPKLEPRPPARPPGAQAGPDPPAD
ncbi:MAG: DUF222 domain-containing protein [Actinomycetota bacterium]